MTVAVGLASGVLLLAAAAIPALLLDLLTRPSSALRRLAPDPPEEPEPAGPPIEQLAVQLRRLSAVLIAPGPVSSVRRFGVERCYDELLVSACQALGVDHRLDTVSLIDREFERLRVESMLQECGLTVRGRSPSPMPERE